LGVDAASLLVDAGIDPTARAEEISIEGFVALANIFSGQTKAGV
jgi:16S rRNA (adenine1518-N6/adenine1519-N6)-dimethyltransferase